MFYSLIAIQTSCLAAMDAAAETLQKIELENAQARSVAGTLTSNPKGLDHKVESLTVSSYSNKLSV